MLFRLSEHDHGVAFVDFSHDDRLLLSGGVPEDRKILIWDMSNGCIVGIVQHEPVPTTVAAWGGMVRWGTTVDIIRDTYFEVHILIVVFLNKCRKSDRRGISSRRNKHLHSRDFLSV